MAILNYTTSIDSTKTISEITQRLVKFGARKIITDYDAAGQATGLTFHIDMAGQLVYYSLPCNWQGVLAAMRKDKSIGPRYCNEAQAVRVSWRIVKDWIEAQLAIVEAGLALLPEIMLPYAITNDGTTLYKRLQSDNQLLLK